MEIFFLVLWTILIYAVGVWTGSDFKKIFSARNKRKAIERVVSQKPQNEFTDYTIDELEAHKKYRENEYKATVHYPALRKGHAEALHKVLEMLDWHYTQNGTYDLHAQRERVKQDLAEFDAKYNAALKGLG